MATLAPASAVKRELEPTAADIEAAMSDCAGKGELVQRCLYICKTYHLTPAELQDEWELLTMNKGKKQELDLETMTELEKQARAVASSKRAKVEKDARAQFSSRPKSVGGFTKDSAHLLLGGAGSAGTPLAGQRRASLTPTTGGSAGGGSPAGAFSTRQDAGKVVTSLNPEAGIAGAEDQLDFAVENAEAAERAGKMFMWEKMDERARLLDAQVEALEAVIEAREDIPPLASVVSASAEEVTVCGRVCCESEGKLNAQSVFLEGSRASSNAMRVRLDLSECPDFALFPGQVVAVCGTNALGHTLVAKAVLPHLPPPARAKAAAPADGPVSVMAAAGPYSVHDDLSYSPLNELLARAAEQKPDCLVLLGPFVDESHPSLADGGGGLVYSEVFERVVLTRIVEFVETQMEADGKVTHVVLLPSLRDAHAMPVFPQPPMSAPPRPEHVAPFLHLLPNPATFSIGGVRVAASSLDVIMLLGQQELARVPPPAPGAPPANRMARLASHIVQQRSLLPIFPTPSDERNPLAVDVVAKLGMATLPSLPDVLLLPSELAPFAKLTTDGVLAINPGRLTRKQAGGNYATLTVRPLPDAAAAAATAALAAAEPTAAEAEAEAEAAVPAEPAAAKAEPPAESAAEGAAEGAAGPERPPAAAAKSPMPADAPLGLEGRACVLVKRI